MPFRSDSQITTLTNRRQIRPFTVTSAFNVMLRLITFTLLHVLAYVAISMCTSWSYQAAATVAGAVPSLAPRLHCSRHGAFQLDLRGSHDKPHDTSRSGLEWHDRGLTAACSRKGDVMRCPVRCKRNATWDRQDRQDRQDDQVPTTRAVYPTTREGFLCVWLRVPGHP